MSKDNKIEVWVQWNKLIIRKQLLIPGLFFLAQA